MKRYQFTIIQTDTNNQQIGKRCGIYYSAGSRLRVAAARAMDKFEKEHGQTSKPFYASIYVREVR